MEIHEALEILKSKRICCGKWGKKAEYADFANATINALEKQIELKEFIEKIRQPQFECLIIDRNGVVNILNKFLVMEGT